MVKEEKTLEEVQEAGFNALERELGPVDTIRFLGAFTTNGRDYSKDRHAWVDSLTAEDIRKSVEELRAAGKLRSGQ
jgi:hypothetical protein